MNPLHALLASLPFATLGIARSPSMQDVPFCFEEDAGQHASEARCACRGAGYRLFSRKRVARPCCARGSSAVGVLQRRIWIEWPHASRTTGAMTDRLAQRGAVPPREKCFCECDARLPLVIDPVLVYATFLGGNHADQDPRLAVDKDGHALVAGWTFSTSAYRAMAQFT